MRKNALSTVYVVNHALKLQGILTISEAVRAHKEGLPIPEVMNRDVETVAPDETVHAILPRAAQSPYPLAVVDEGGSLIGIVTKAAVLASLAQD
jgi:glycine betaine/proline transport system ATP-binding protein